jgi:hypothetical protein
MGQGLKVETGPREKKKLRGSYFCEWRGGAAKRGGLRMDLKTIPFLGAFFYI